MSNDLGVNINVDRKASTPSSSSSDVSKNQTFLDKKIKTFLAVITWKHHYLRNKLIPLFDRKLFFFFISDFRMTCLLERSKASGRDGVVHCTTMWQIDIGRSSWSEMNSTVETRCSHIALIVKVSSDGSIFFFLHFPNWKFFILHPLILIFSFYLWLRLFLNSIKTIVTILVIED